MSFRRVFHAAFILGTILGARGEVLAADGFVPYANGLRHKALAGAGAASIEDATGVALNPAGLVGIGDQLSLGLSFYVPERGFKAVNTVEADWGSFTSDRKVHPLPMLAYVRQIDRDSAIAFSLQTNNGLRTSYDGTSGVYGLGPFRSGKAGLDLAQLFISVAYARRIDGRFSIGIAPVFALQRFRAYGLSPYAGLSVDPNNVSDRGYSYAYGGGVRFGVLWNVTDRLSLGATFQTKIWMSRFGRYRGLLADQGVLDMPADLQVGLAYRLTESLRIMLDYRHVFHEDVKSLANPGSDCLVAPPSSLLGGGRGCGFHWRDANVIKLGLEYRATDRLTLRAGYAYAFPSSVRRDAMFFNTVTPGVVRHRITAGASWQASAASSVDVAFMYAPRTSLSGPEVPPWAGTSYGGTIRNWARQLEFSIGWTYRFPAGSVRRP